MHPFDLALALERQGPDRVRGHTSEQYWNFVSPYGGITAAVLLSAIEQHPQRIGDPLTLTVNYAAPITPGPFVLTTRLLRASRTTQHWAVYLTQGDDEQPLATGLTVFALRRATWNLTEATPPDVAHLVESREPMPFGRLRWPAMYDIRYVRGSFTEPNQDSLTYSWISDREPRALDYASLTSMCDAFFPRVFLRRAQLVPVGTVSLNVYFHLDAQTLALQGTSPVLAMARGNVFSQGYFDQEGQMWGNDARLLATTHQVVWYKE
jgi:hypothetical protein